MSTTMESKKISFLTNNFFHELLEGRLTSADKMLQIIKEEAHGRERQKGYVNALEGMLSALESKNDKCPFINQIRSKEVDKFARMFTNQAKNRMQSEFDHGFFTAWVDYTRVLKDSSKLEMETKKRITTTKPLDIYAD